MCNVQHAYRVGVVREVPYRRWFKFLWPFNRMARRRASQVF